jgi:putative isomerase
MFSLTGVRKFDLSSFVLFATFVMCICSHTFFKSITTDNVLVAYMMAMTGKKELAYSSLIQVVRSRTAKGFVPNFSAGGAKSQDRSEPPLGAKVLREIYETYNEAWLVELLWDDLAVQIDWFWWNRRLDGFIALGSDPVAYPNAHSTNTMQGARFESGLDNSPMYDGKFFKDGLMQLYDVGMTSLVLQECESLVNLASIIGRDASQLEYRSQVLRQSLMTLWDADDGIFSNQFPNGTYSKRRSPTSFYPLLSHVATDAQAESMVEHWLMNSTRFCIGQRSSECWWGLPSISADDPAFPKLGYWRGYVWGPMSLLTYWALENYQHLPRIALAKQQLVSQMTDMFLNLWRQKGRVCENYSPNRDAKDCTGDKFYHWGALAGLLSLLEQQHEEELAVLVA